MLVGLNCRRKAPVRAGSLFLPGTVATTLSGLSVFGVVDVIVIVLILQRRKLRHWSVNSQPEVLFAGAGGGCGRVGLGFFEPVLFIITLTEAQSLAQALTKAQLRLKFA